MLKMFQFDAADKNFPKCEHFEIALNACDIDVLTIETKVKILIKYSTEHYVLFNIDEIDKSIELELQKERDRHCSIIIRLIIHKSNFRIAELKFC